MEELDLYEPLSIQTAHSTDGPKNSPVKNHGWCSSGIETPTCSNYLFQVKNMSVTGGTRLFLRPRTEDLPATGSSDTGSS